MPTPSASIIYRNDRNIDQRSIIALYEANHWSSARKPDLLHKALLNSHSLITAWDGETLVGLGNAISDGFLVVYYPHLVVLPAYQGLGIGRQLVQRLMEPYKNFHQQMLVSDGKAVGFYQKCGFYRAGETEPLWIYQGDEH